MLSAAVLAKDTAIERLHEEKAVALAQQQVHGIFHPFGEENGAGRCGLWAERRLDYCLELVLWIEPVECPPVRAVSTCGSANTNPGETGYICDEGQR